MSEHLNTTANKRQNSDSTFKVSPFQSRGFGVQTKSQESVSASKAELWDNYQQAKQLNQKGANSVSVPIQAKLTIGQPGDKYEQEADSVADRVMSMSEPTQVQREGSPGEEELQMKPLAQTISPLLQRAAMPEQELQMKPEDNVVQRQELPEEEELQMKSLANSIQREELPEKELQMKQSSSNAQTATPALESQLSRSKGGGSQLSDDVRSFMEPRFGADFSQVRVHTDSESVQMNRELNAQAFAHGRDIYFGAGKYNPGSGDGKRLLAHELTHVVQQTGGVQRQPVLSIAQDNQAKQHITSSQLVLKKSSELIQCESLWERGKKVVKETAGQAVDWAKEQAKKLVEGVKRQADEFIQGMKREANTLIEKAKGGARQLVENAKRQAMKLVENAKRQVTNLIEKAKRQAAKFVQMAHQQVKKLLSKAMSEAKNLLQKAVRQANKLAQPIISLAQKLVQGGKVKKAQQLIERLKQKSDRIIEGAKRQALAGAQVATRQATQIIDGATRVAESVINGATRGAQLLFTGAIKATEGVIQGVQRGINGVIIGARSIAQVAERGKNRVRSILKPIEGVAGGLVNSIMGVANGIVQFAMRGVEMLGGYAKKLIEPAAQAMRRATTQIGGFVQKKIQPFMQQVRSGVQKVAQNAREASQNAVQGLVINGVNAVTTVVRQVFKTAIDLIDALILKPLAALMELAELLMRLMSSAGGVLDQILEDPFAFIKNLFSGLGQGFSSFAGNIGLHLQNGLQNFLLGALGSTPIELPQSFDLEGILSIATQLMGLSYQQLRERGVKKLGESNVAMLEQGVEAVKTGKEGDFGQNQIQNQLQGNPLIAQAAGLFQAFRQGAKGVIKFFSNINFNGLMGMVIEGVQSYLMEKVVSVAIPKIVAYFTPGAGWVLAAIDAFKMIYTLFIENAQKLAALVEGFSQSIIGAANRDVSKAAKSLESGLAQTFPMLIQVLADWLGVGDIGKTIQKFLNNGVAWVNQTIGPVIDSVIDTVASLFSEMMPGGNLEAKNEATGKASNKAESSHSFTDSAVTSTLGGLLPGAKGEQGKPVDLSNGGK